MITVPYPGGKAKIYKQILPYFEQMGTTYIEPFAGRGNVFLNFREDSMFDHYILNDAKTGRWFKALLEITPEDLPEDPDFYDYRDRSYLDDPVAIVIEPWITYGSKGYDHGAQSHKSSTRYRKERVAGILKAAKRILKGVEIHNTDYSNLDYSTADFVYFDPPYYQTDGVGYNNIDHNKFLAFVLDLDCQWLVSGYYSDLYREYLGEPVLQLERNLELSPNSNTAIECLWKG